MDAAQAMSMKDWPTGIRQKTHMMLDPLPGDKIGFTIVKGQQWEAFSLAITNITEKKTMRHFDILADDGHRRLEPGTDYTYINDDTVLFTTPLVGPQEVFLNCKLVQPKTMHFLLLPRQTGHYIFSDEALQKMVDESVGKDYPVNRLPDTPEDFKQYTKAVIISARVTEAGIEAVVELG